MRPSARRIIPDDLVTTFPPLPPYRPAVVLLHGIRTDGPWFADAQRQLDRFFDTVPMPYGEYRHLGALKLVVEPWFTAGGLAAAALAWLGTAGLGSAGRTGLAVTVGVVGLWVAHRRARARLDRVREGVARAYGERFREPGRRPHVIAHSLGSYAAASAMRKYTRVKFDRAVVCGSVLPRTFDWTVLAAPEYGQIAAVRNEQGLRDPIPRIAGLADVVARALPRAVARAARGVSHVPDAFGDSGSRGFVGDPGAVHRVPAQDAACPACERAFTLAMASGAPARAEAALVHNVPLPFTHSDHFTGGLQCAGQWLPFLLGYDPGEFEAVMTLCARAHQAESRADFSARDECEARLLTHPWRWARGTVLDRALLILQHVHYPLVVDDLLFLLRPVALLTVGLFWRQVALAQLARDASGLEGRTSGWADVPAAAVASLDLAATLAACAAEAAQLQAAAHEGHAGRSASPAAPAPPQGPPHPPPPAP